MSELVGTLQESWEKVRPQLEGIEEARRHSWSQELGLRHLIKSHAWLNANLNRVTAMLKVPYSTNLTRSVDLVGHYGQAIRLLRGRVRDASIEPDTPHLQNLTSEAAALRLKALQAAAHLEMLRKVPEDFGRDIRRGTGYGDTQEDMARLAEALDANWNVVESIQNHLPEGDELRLSRHELTRMQELAVEIERELNRPGDPDEARQQLTQLLHHVTIEWNTILAAYSFAAQLGAVEANDAILKPLFALRRKSTPKPDAPVSPESDAPAAP